MEQDQTVPSSPLPAERLGDGSVARAAFVGQFPGIRFADIAESAKSRWAAVETAVLSAAKAGQQGDGVREALLHAAARKLIGRWEEAPDLPLEMEEALTEFEVAWLRADNALPNSGGEAWRWRRVSDTPDVGGSVLIGGYVNGALGRMFEIAWGCVIRTLNGPAWSISEAGKEHVPIQYWCRLPAHPEHVPNGHRAATSAPVGASGGVAEAANDVRALCNSAIGDAYLGNEAEIELAHKVKAALAQPAPSARPHLYSPSYQHQGDCRICGNMQDSPLHIRSTPAPSARPAEAEMVEAASRALCKKRGTGQCAALCLSNFSMSTTGGRCPEAVRIWGDDARAALAAAFGTGQNGEPQPRGLTPEHLAAAIDEMAVNPKGGKMAALAYKKAAHLIREKLSPRFKSMEDALCRAEWWLTTAPESDEIVQVCRAALATIPGGPDARR